MSEQFIVALPGASALRSHPSRVPFFRYAREQSGSDGMRKAERLAILQVLVSVLLGSSRCAVASLQLARANEARQRVRQVPVVGGGHARSSSVRFVSAPVAFQGPAA